MMDMSNMSRDFMPRPQRPRELAPGGGFGGQPQTREFGRAPVPPGVGTRFGGQSQPPHVSPDSSRIKSGALGGQITQRGNMPPPGGFAPGGGYGGQGQVQSGEFGYSPDLPPGGVPGVAPPGQPPGGTQRIDARPDQVFQPGTPEYEQAMELASGGGGFGPPQTPGGTGLIHSDRPQQPPGEAGGFPYPEQWGQAGDIYGQLAGGMPGMPDPSAMWGGYQQQAGDLSRQLAEQAGMGMGGRYGSALQRNIADVGMRTGERFGGEMERLRMGDIAGQRQAMLGAAGGLSGLGGAQAMLPGQLAGQAMGLGGQFQQMQNIPIQANYQEWLRQQPEYSPYLPAMQQGAQVPYGPQTYQPGFGSNMMDIGGMMGMYGMMGG